MKDTDIQNLSEEEIIQKIKQEVVRLRSEIDIKAAQMPQDQIDIPQNIQESKFYNFAKKVGKFLQRKGFSTIVNIVRNNLNLNKFNRTYTIEDFSKYHDEEFINNAYKNILNRPADSNGKKYYLEQLRHGLLSKTEIITTIHYSKEGRRQNIVILGSKKRYIMTIVYKIPIIGYIAKLSYTLLTLPKLLKRLNQYENYIGAEFTKQNINNQQLHNQVNKLQKDKVDENTLIQIQRELEQKLLLKAEKKEIEQKLLLKVEKKELEQKLLLKVDENTLIQAQIDIYKKLEKKVNTSELEFPEIPNSLEIQAMDFLSDAISKFPHPIENFKDFDKEELYYSLFESTFYNHEVVLKKQLVYLNYIPKTNSSKDLHLDIGCGRGELLTLLKQNNYHAMGIDVNSIEIQTLKKQNYLAEHSDMIEFLETTNNSFSSISALQVIEHIDYDTLKKFISLAYSKIKKDGVIILETINPHNKVAFNSFYMDETHKRPIPPEMLAFILQYAGFKNIKFVYISPMPQEFRSKNNNYINYHDYAVIGYKI